MVHIVLQKLLLIKKNSQFSWIPSKTCKLSIAALNEIFKNHPKWCCIFDTQFFFVSRHNLAVNSKVNLWGMFLFFLYNLQQQFIVRKRQIKRKLARHSLNWNGSSGKFDDPEPKTQVQLGPKEKDMVVYKLLSLKKSRVLAFWHQNKYGHTRPRVCIWIG